MPARIPLADPRRATPGSCCICGAPASQWHRSQRRSTDADGLVLAVRCCDAHESEALASLGALTITAVAATVPRPRHRQRADAARRRADRLTGRSHCHARISAGLAGASSATHTHALLGGIARLEADALLLLAEALA